VPLPTQRPTSEGLDPAFAGEILGCAVALDHPGLAERRVEGVLVDETMNTFLVRVGRTGRTVRIPKAGATGTIVLAGRPLPLRGELLRQRPEDRTKRLATRGRRR
jgi:RNase P/RNase MRP subunit p29